MRDPIAPSGFGEGHRPRDLFLVDRHLGVCLQSAAVFVVLECFVRRTVEKHNGIDMAARAVEQFVLVAAQVPMCERAFELPYLAYSITSSHVDRDKHKSVEKKLRRALKGRLEKI